MRRFAIPFLLITAPLFAQAPGAANTFGQSVAPFIDENTLVVVRVDVSRFDVDTAIKLTKPFLGDPEGARETVKAVKKWVNEFNAVGKDIFFAYGAGDFPNPPCLIVSAPADEAGQKKLAGLLSIPFKRVGATVDSALIHGCICVGTKDALSALQARKSVERPELTAAMEAGKDGVAQVAIAMSADAKKIYEQVAPTLPVELGGGRIQVVTRGLNWLALVVGAGPKMPTKLITEATSPQAAQDLHEIEDKAQSLLLTQLLDPENTKDPAIRKRVDALMRGSATTLEASRLTIEWDLATAFAELVKFPAGPPADRIRSANNLKQIMLAMHNYHDVYGRFPADIRDKDGKPLLSWRVQILPYISQVQLYKQFKLDEPWDSEHNKKLIPLMPRTFHSPRQTAALKDKTTYLAPLGKNFIFDDPKGIKISQITDGTSNTIAIVEADDDRAVIWSKPEDMAINVKNPIDGLLGHYTDGFHTAFADGSVRFIKKSIDPKSLWALFTKDGGEIVVYPK